MTSAAGDWIGWAAVVLVLFAGLVIGSVLLAARWPDIVRWVAARRRSSRKAQSLEERDRLRGRIASLIAENERLRAERNRYRRERDDARGTLEDERRNSVTIIQMPRAG